MSETKAELYAKAKSLGIKGRSRMCKAELVQACKTATSDDLVSERAYARIVVKYFKSSKSYLTKRSKMESCSQSIRSLTDNYDNKVSKELRDKVSSTFVNSVYDMIEYGIWEILYQQDKIKKKYRIKKIISENPSIGSKKLDELKSSREILLFVLMKFRDILGNAFVESK